MTKEQEKAFLASLEPKAKRGELTTKAEIKDAFERQVGHQVHKSTIYRLLERHQWHKIKPRPRHPKADPEEQDAFIASFEEQVQQLNQQRDPKDKRPLLVMASDEGRFGRTGEVHPCWCPPGFRPTIARQQVRQYVYAYAAVAPALGFSELFDSAVCQHSNDESISRASVARFCGILRCASARPSSMAGVLNAYKCKSSSVYCRNHLTVLKLCPWNTSGMMFERSTLITIFSIPWMMWNLLCVQH